MCNMVVSGHVAKWCIFWKKILSVFSTVEMQCVSGYEMLLTMTDKIRRDMTVGAEGPYAFLSRIKLLKGYLNITCFHLLKPFWPGSIQLPKLNHSNCNQTDSDWNASDSEKVVSNPFAIMLFIYFYTVKVITIDIVNNLFLHWNIIKLIRHMQLLT